MSVPVVLLVDDNEDCRIIYGSTLRHAGYTVRTACDGLQCLESVAEEVPDLILLDIGMPRMDGMEALERLKKDPHTNGIPVVAVSARVGHDQQASVLKAGFTEVLLKPITPSDILESVKRHLPLDGH
jgi:chemosensory pili system protein ChpA (sensor histidine kinase/response regulator)